MSWHLPATIMASAKTRQQTAYGSFKLARSQIKAPELITRKHIINARAAADDLKIDEDVVDFLADKITSNIRTLLGAVNRVVAYSNLTGETCTVAMASEVLKDILTDGPAA